LSQVAWLEPPPPPWAATCPPRPLARLPALQLLSVLGCISSPTITPRGHGHGTPHNPVPPPPPLSPLSATATPVRSSPLQPIQTHPPHSAPLTSSPHHPPPVHPRPCSSMKRSSAAMADPVADIKVGLPRPGPTDLTSVPLPRSRPLRSPLLSHAIDHCVRRASPTQPTAAVIAQSS